MQNPRGAVDFRIPQVIAPLNGRLPASFHGWAYWNHGARWRTWSRYGHC